MTHTHIEPLEAARARLLDINTMIVDGSICNPRFVLKSKAARILIESFHDDCTFAGINGVYSALFISAAGFLALQYAFTLPDGTAISGYLNPIPPKTDE